MTFEDHLTVAKDVYEAEHPGARVLIAYVCVSESLLNDPDSEEAVATLVGRDVSKAAVEAVKKSYRR